MGPKKQASAAKKDPPENGGELTPEAKAKLFMLTCQSLQVQLAERSEEAAKALAAKREYQERIQQIAKDFEEEKQQTFQIRQDMTRQYKSMQEELVSRINNLEKTIEDLQDQLSEAASRQARVVKEKDAEIQMKNSEIMELKSKMDEMAEEFGEMLRETLDKMRERIDVASTNFDAPDLMIQQRMDEIKLDT